MRERGEEGVERRLQLLRGDVVVLKLQLLEPVPLLPHREHELIEEDGVDHAEQADARHEVEEDEEERNRPVDVRDFGPSAGRRIVAAGGGIVQVTAAGPTMRRRRSVVADQWARDIWYPAFVDADLEHTEDSEAEVAWASRRKSRSY